MAEIENMRAALDERILPTVTRWNRLEGRPRLADFDRALRAEVRDPLWMLARQWQLGELFGDDAGSPVFAQAHVATTRLTKYRAGDHDAREFLTTVPLEAQVEARPVPYLAGGAVLSLDLRLLLGRRWLKLVRAVGDFDDEFIDGYPVDHPDPDDPADALIVAHPEVWQQVAALAGRVMDGYLLYDYLRADAAHHAYDGTSIDAADFTVVDELADRFRRWADTLFYQPPTGDAWQPDRLEYQFAVSAPTPDGERVYLAEQYYQGRLDWYNVDAAPAAPPLSIPGDPPTPGPPEPTTTSFIPVQVVFDGMPNTRWWAFEDRKTNFGDIRPDTTDLAKLLFMEFGLVYANDWYLVPQSLPAGSIAHVAGLAVTNVFGERFWIEPSGSGAGDQWQRWSMFTNGTDDLVLLPTVPKIQEGRPLEEVCLIRDEMANMVWGVETRVPLATGGSRPGEELARETLVFHRRILDAAIADGTVVPPAGDPQAPIRYRVMGSVPENWIPFIPVHVDGDNREIQLQRAAMPRILDGDPAPAPVRVRPRTVLLREGLDAAPPRPYFLHEEEVPRSGVAVSQRFQRTRWYDGRVVTWVGVHKQTARRTRSSGLGFDYLQAT
ncbi:hypothetical protein [Paractinoplanes brasiliensis]|uniref:Uncharacterized protein n=1 Tax=Paractinoplanes brasiliensis TaxID=52695 RepID=A0A4R6K2H5_9ACTN|nr:hypothetical protein [Actinoplanes brasiliensis]TDO41856.1 hypothetical protein C8E87_5609 [Actinoplanes brasiliensis]GID29866.1 hypothetical protein Abr02nite_48490 [Actinoplanes brasiliensis]